LPNSISVLNNYKKDLQTMFLKCIPANPEKYDCITWLTVERENLSTPIRAIMYILRLTKIIP